MARAGCWPTPVVAEECWSQAASGLQEGAADIAAAILWYGTGGQFDLCPLVYRPCVSCVCGCGEWSAYIDLNGVWRNGCRNCNDLCCGVEEVILPTAAYSVTQVLVDGAALDASNYRLDNRRRLVRTDGLTWPHCQDMREPTTEPLTFSVEYTQSRLDAAGLHAYGTLANEILKSQISDATCRLPQGITTVSREGITIDFDVLGELATRTGLIEVDLWLRMVNPTGSAHAFGAVLSPDTLRRPTGRATTWGA